jgi:hypothetical protein
MLVVLLVLSGGFLLLAVFFAYQASGVESASIPSDRQSHADQSSLPNFTENGLVLTSF